MKTRIGLLSVLFALFISPAFAVPRPDPSPTAENEDSDATQSQAVEWARTALLAVGGAWALYIYKTSRRGQLRVGIEPTVRFHRDAKPGESILYVKLRITNTSGVLFRYREAIATLLDASERTEDGEVRLVPFAQADPFVPVYGRLSDDPEAISRGETFALGEKQKIMLEPGEHVDSEIALLLRTKDVGPMAMQVSIKGKQWWFWRAYWWGSFFFIDPAIEKGAKSATLETASDGGAREGVDDASR